MKRLSKEEEKELESVLEEKTVFMNISQLYFIV